MGEDKQIDKIVLYWLIALFVLVVSLIISILSRDICNKVLLSLALVFGIVGVLTILAKHRNFEVGFLKYSLQLATAMFVLWAFFKIIGTCTLITKLLTLLIRTP